MPLSFCSAPTVRCDPSSLIYDNNRPPRSAASALPPPLGPRETLSEPSATIGPSSPSPYADGIAKLTLIELRSHSDYYDRAIRGSLCQIGVF
jgi:hypothetical protein